MASIKTDTELRAAIRHVADLQKIEKKERRQISVDTGLSLVCFDDRRSWCFNTRIGGKRVVRYFGEYPAMTMQEAKDQCRVLASAHESGEKLSKRYEKIRHVGDTVSDLWSVFMQSQRNRNAYSNPKDYERVESRKKFFVDRIGSLRPEQVKAGDISDVLNPLYINQPETAKKLRTVLGQFFNWCSVNGYYPEEKRLPTDKDYIKVLTVPENKRGKTQHFPMCPVEDLPRLVMRITEQPNFLLTSGGLALIFEILTCTRFANIGMSNSHTDSGVIHYAVWGDITKTRDGMIWTIPEEKMKVCENKDHVVPLSRQAEKVLELIKAQRGNKGKDDPVFQNHLGRPLSDGCFKKIIDRVIKVDEYDGWGGFYDPDVGKKKITPHGTARATFLSWVVENGHDKDIANLCLHHAVGKVEQAYNRSQAIALKRELLQKWADYVTSECECF